MVEEGLKSEEQFCIAEESRILINREELEISNSKEHNYISKIQLLAVLLFKNKSHKIDICTL